MRTNTPLEIANAEKRKPSGIEAAEEARIEVNRTSERDDADLRLEVAAEPARRDEEYAPVEAARRTSDTDRRV